VEWGTVQRESNRGLPRAAVSRLVAKHRAPHHDGHPEVADDGPLTGCAPERRAQQRYSREEAKVVVGSKNSAARQEIAARDCAARRRQEEKSSRQQSAEEDVEKAEALRERYERLTPREREVLALVAAGQLNKQIAGELATSERTVKFHRAHVMEKMAAASLAELVQMAGQLGLSPEGGAGPVPKDSTRPVPRDS